MTCARMRQTSDRRIAWVDSAGASASHWHRRRTRHQDEPGSLLETTLLAHYTAASRSTAGPGSALYPAQKDGAPRRSRRWGTASIETRT